MKKGDMADETGESAHITGRRADGVRVRSTIPRAALADTVERRYRQGWTFLYAADDDGNVIGEIGHDLETDGRRVWWAEDVNDTEEG